MTLVLPGVQRKPSFSEKLSQGVGRGLEIGSQLMQQQEAKKLQQQQGQQLSEMIGMDVSSLDPEIQKVALQLSLQGKNQQVLELLKQESKKGLLKEKQDFLGQILGKGSQSQQNSQIPQEIGTGESQISQGWFDPNSLSDADIAQATAVDPNLGRMLQTQKDSAIKNKIANEKLDLAKLKSSPEYQRQQHLESSQAQADVKYNQQLQENSKQHELKEKSLNRLEQLNKKGVTGKAWEKFAEKAGFVNVTSEGRREFAAEVKSLITDIRSILGGQFSNFEFQTILNAYPSADFSKEANSAIIKNLKEFQDIKKKEVQFANQIKKENGGKLPYDYQSLVNEKVHEYTSSRLPEIKENTRQIMNEQYDIPKGYTLMFDPNGDPLSVADNEIEKWKALGAELP
jgi:hypothetical protein